MYICRVFIGRMYVPFKVSMQFSSPSCRFAEGDSGEMNPKLTETYLYSKRQHQDGSVLMFSRTSICRFWEESLMADQLMSIVWDAS